MSVDPKESHIDAYRGVTILTPNQHEAGWVQGRRVTDEASLMEVGWGLSAARRRGGAGHARRADGMSLFERGGRYTHLPTVAREVFDVTGAGDTVIATLALGLCAGGSLAEAAALANAAASVVVGKLGTAQATPSELLQALRAVTRRRGSSVRRPGR